MQEAIIMSSQTTTDTSTTTTVATTTSEGFYPRKIDTGTELSVKGESI